MGMPTRSNSGRSTYGRGLIKKKQDEKRLWLSAFPAAAAHQAAGAPKGPAAVFTSFACAAAASGTAALAVGGAAREGQWSSEASERVLRAKLAEEQVQTILLRDIFGNPFQHSPDLDAHSRTQAVQALAKDIYEARSWDRLADLANLLEETGCRDSRLLSHLRDSGPHALGCWGLDLVLGKR
jgi:hypothetical protein